MKNGIPRLTLKTARELVRREMGISPAALRKVDLYSPEACLYEMTAGRFDVKVINGWSDGSRSFILQIASCSGPSIRLFYDPKTLEEDFYALGEYERENKKERCEGCALAQAAREAQE